MSGQYLTDVRACPTCGLEAVRVPEYDTEREIAFQCQTGIDQYKNKHPFFLEAPPTGKSKSRAVPDPVETVIPEVAKEHNIVVKDSLVVGDEQPGQKPPRRQHESK